jgi:hypothetical protein
MLKFFFVLTVVRTLSLIIGANRNNTIEKYIIREKKKLLSNYSREKKERKRAKITYAHSSDCFQELARTSEFSDQN